ncbi:MAG TPA: hypothetical protein VEA99_14120, partial [Gemmatimonadaceae bacterium]|nr:hypothetical protein [Gemmatimonadaceae bacterium]
RLAFDMMPTEPAGAPRPTLVLLHGLGRTARAMRPIERAGRSRGWRVLNLDYRSRRADIAAHARMLGERLRTEAPEGALSFVTHSLGGIVLRQAVAAGELPLKRVCRVVMLAPPNRGSEIADLWWSDPLLGPIGRRMMGPALAAVRTVAEAEVQRLPPVPFECGIIAGTRSLNPLFSRRIPGPNDGKVAVARAEVAGMRALLTVPHSHTFIMAMPRVIAQTFSFLERGVFAGE